MAAAVALVAQQLLVLGMMAAARPRLAQARAVVAVARRCSPF